MAVLRPFWLGLLLVVIEAPPPAPAQYPPGQYPGGIPPGNGGLGIPVPRRHKKNEEQAQLESTTGMLRRLRKDEIVLEADDHRILNYKRTDATHFLKLGNAIKPADLAPGDFVEIESNQDDEGFMTAVNVMWQQDGTAKDRAHAIEPVQTSLAKDAKNRVKDSGSEDKKETPAAEPAKPSAPPAPPATPATPPAPSAPTAAAASSADDPNPADLNAPAKDQVKSVQIDTDDQGPPVLKRGGSAAHKQTEAPPPQAAETAAPAPELSARNETPAPESEPPVRGPQRHEEVVIEKAREAAGMFLETLPNYYCQELMTRYQTASNSKNWQPLDVISMALVYENGQESYRNLQINGKASKKSMADLPGSWSTGEFGSVLKDVFSPYTAADFEYRKESRSAGRPSLVFDFTVEREHSHWQVMVASQSITPAYQGSVWIDKETNRVLRIEMQATHIPDAFPSDKVEMATDYEFVRFADRQYLVPVHAESMGCQRDTSTCSRNSIDFRNYHRYAGESSITFDK